MGVLPDSSPQSYDNVPPPMDEIQLAKQLAQVVVLPLHSINGSFLLTCLCSTTSLD